MRSALPLSGTPLKKMLAELRVGSGWWGVGSEWVVGSGELERGSESGEWGVCLREFLARALAQVLRVYFCLCHVNLVAVLDLLVHFSISMFLDVAPPAR